jgi:catechol 2,3-dioxygenase-like lactoylglutathione lyase family enzyme
MPPPAAVLETILYAPDLDATRHFYRDVMGFELYSQVPGRHLFFRLERQMLLIFDPAATEVPPRPGALPVPPHGARGPGHVCFAATAGEIDDWRRQLEAHGIVIESDFSWPSSDPAKRGRSIYFRDPAGNSVELAEGRIWGL